MAGTRYVTKAKRYAKAVTSGKKVAGKYVKLACQRFLDDLQRSDLVFNAKEADRACRFMEKFSHVKGRWARDGERLQLGDWQCFIVVSLFGFFRKDGTRKYREAYIRVARKNGKSMLAAAIGLYMFVADGEFGAEVYSGATSEKQAWEVFGPARLMALRHPLFRGHYNVEINAKNMNVPEDNSKFEPVIGNPGDGPSPSLAIIDEFHEHKTWDLYNTMDTGQAAREQPLRLIITTAGTNYASPCFEKDDDARRILEGKFKDDAIFAIIFAADEPEGDLPGDHWTSVNAMKKANPNLGVSVSRSYLEDQLGKAKRSPQAQAAFKTKNLNLWVSSGSAFLNSLDWARAGKSRLNIDDYRQWRCIFGLDLASRIDFVALVKLFFRFDDSERMQYALFPRFFLPEGRLEDDKSKQYAAWHERGYFETHEGDEIDFALLKDAILEEAREYGPSEIAYDPWRAIGLEQSLTNEGLTMVKIPQTIAHMTSPMDELQAAVPTRLVHDNNPVMNWMMGNLVAREDTNGNKKPRRENPRNKIDGAVATLNAMNRALAQPEAGLDDWLNSVTT